MAGYGGLPVRSRFVRSSYGPGHAVILAETSLRAADLAPSYGDGGQLCRSDGVHGAGLEGDELGEDEGGALDELEDGAEDELDEDELEDDGLELELELDGLFDGELELSTPAPGWISCFVAIGMLG